MSTPADAIVVLGAGVHPDGTMGRSARERVEAGVKAWRAGLAPWLLLTGGPSDALLRGRWCRRWRRFAATTSEATEAAAMRRLALLLGVPAEAVLVEEEARSTEENARFAARLMRRGGLTRALLVTQPYHERRSLAVFTEAGIDADVLALEGSWIFAGGWDSLGALRWVAREYAIWLLAKARGKAWAGKKNKTRNSRSKG